MRLRYTQAGAPELGLRQSAKRGWDHKQPARARILAEEHSNERLQEYVLRYYICCHLICSTVRCLRAFKACQHTAQRALSIHCRS